MSQAAATAPASPPVAVISFTTVKLVHITPSGSPCGASIAAAVRRMSNAIDLPSRPSVNVADCSSVTPPGQRFTSAHVPGSTPAGVAAVPVGSSRASFKVGQ